MYQVSPRSSAQSDGVLRPSSKAARSPGRRSTMMLTRVGQWSSPRLNIDAHTADNFSRSWALFKSLSVQTLSGLGHCYSQGSFNNRPADVERTRRAVCLQPNADFKQRCSGFSDPKLWGWGGSSCPLHSPLVQREDELGGIMYMQQGSINSVSQHAALNKGSLLSDNCPSVLHRKDAALYPTEKVPG